MRHILMTIACAISLSVPALAQQDTVIHSSRGDQEAVAVTIYNHNLGLVKETRSVSLPHKSGELRYADVASHIIPASVHVRSLTSADKFDVLEQNYEYDLMNPDKLLDKYVGKEITIVDFNEYNNQKQEIQAKLLSNNDGQILKIGDKIYLGHPGYRALPQIPENLIAKPTLMWQYGNRGPAKQQLEVSYLTNRISWQADYVLVIGKDDRTGDLGGWVTIDNKSGATYPNATLKLVAGDINRVEKPRGREPYATKMALSEAAPRFREQEFFEYHLYDLQRTTTIKDNQTKQIQLMDAGDIAMQKRYFVRGEHHYYLNRYGNDDKQPVHVKLEIENRDKNNLGMPLPAGIVRMYKKDADGSQQFVGEDRIEHTPKNEKITLTAGEAFDVVAERKQTDFEQIGTKAFETAWEIELRNHKKGDVTVLIEEPLRGDWKIVSKSHEYNKIDAHTIGFDVTVPKNGKTTVTYRVRVQR